MHPVDMRVYHVKLVGVLRHGFEQRGASGCRVGTWPSEAKRLRPRGVELCAGAGVATGKKRHLMSETDEFIDQPSDDAFCAAIEFWRNAFSQRCDLRNAHRF